MSGDLEAQEWLRDGARQSIEKYRSGGITLRQLIDDLDAIWSNFAQSAWSENLRSQWWVLEELYAVALDRGDQEELPLEDQQAIDAALNELDRLLM
ncbi:hypothetical protein [Streptomyces sp. YIM 98790]|uniref:hypothetical protein n=1 Tax=Streptomyces sp. YIM 98790 TaxID=2689077 RepID=UPI00140A6306|nr:hypothetical protein [Streptomyces sp. YIM 98790]